MTEGTDNCHSYFLISVDSAVTVTSVKPCCCQKRGYTLWKGCTNPLARYS